MKLAISSTGKDLQSTVDSRFGRAQYFVIYDTEAEEFEILKNEDAAGAHGVGAQTAQKIANSGVKIVITGNVGPNAFNVLKAAGITIYTVESSTIEGALEAYKNDELKAADGATKKGH